MKRVLLDCYHVMAVINRDQNSKLFQNASVFSEGISIFRLKSPNWFCFVGLNQTENHRNISVVSRASFVSF